MEIQVKTNTTRQSFRVRPLANPFQLLASNEISLFHTDCGGHVSIDGGREDDPESWATIRCNLCFEANREKRMRISSALGQVLVEHRRSDACTVLAFVPLSPRERLTHGPVKSRIQSYFRRR